MNPHSFLEPHSRAIRVWHWTFVLFVTATIAIVLLASTVFRTRNTVPLVQQQLHEKGITVTPDQARAVAHEFNDQLWDIHRLLGYGLCILLISRWFAVVPLLLGCGLLFAGITGTCGMAILLAKMPWNRSQSPCLESCHTSERP